MSHIMPISSGLSSGVSLTRSKTICAASARATASAGGRTRSPSSEPSRAISTRRMGSGERTTSTGQPAPWSTRSVTLPQTARRMPVSPWVLMTIRSTPRSLATSTMAAAGSPISSTARTTQPGH